MRADEIAAITVGSVAVAGLIGFGIYRFMKKDKPRSEGSEDKISPEMEAFGSASAITSKPTTYDHFERVQTLPPRAG
jgi:hypothetical protein